MKEDKEAGESGEREREKGRGRGRRGEEGGGGE